MNERSFNLGGTMPRGKTRKTLSAKDLKRRRILRAATEVFAEKGYFNARMTDIAHRAGVADGTLYLYFQGKEHILISIFEEAMTNFIRRAQEEIENLEDPLKKLRVVLRLHLETVGRNRALAHVLQVETRHSRRFMSLFTRGKLGEYLGLIRSIVEEGQKSGKFTSKVSPGLATGVIFGAVDELATSWLLADPPYDLLKQLPGLMKMLSSGLEARPDSG